MKPGPNKADKPPSSPPSPVLQVRGIGGDLVEEVALIDSFTSPKNGADVTVTYLMISVILLYS